MKLVRDVAVTILPEEVASDPERIRLALDEVVASEACAPAGPVP